MINYFYFSLAIYYFISLVVIIAYSLNNPNRIERYKIGYIAAIVILMPYFGIFFIIFLNYYPEKKDGETIDDFEVNTLLSMDTNSHYLNLNVEKESNIVPIEEALIINSNKTKRMLLIEALKQDIYLSSTFLKKAVNDSDTETSHYAAAALMDLKNRLMTGLQALSVKYEADKEDVDISIAYAEVIRRYIHSGMLDVRSIKKYRYLYIQILENINRLEPEKREYFVERINTELKLKEYSKAAQSCEGFMKLHSNSEEPFIMTLKLCYTLGDTKKFKYTLEKLRNSQIKLSYSALNKLRFWIEEGEL
jgi:hypothetical protein